ncbi:TPA: AI-2E family transporter, partial [Streptococcus pyogenes]|nr:AI-2E family transporter [Streptococcus pyogenes]
MPLIPEKSRTDSLFYKWFLNNQATMALVITLLAFLTIFVFTKISFLFMPVISFFAVIMLPLV